MIKATKNGATTINEENIVITCNDAQAKDHLVKYLKAFKTIPKKKLLLKKSILKHYKKTHIYRKQPMIKLEYLVNSNMKILYNFRKF